MKRDRAVPSALQMRVVGSGMTIVELLVALSVIGVLTALILPAVMRARQAARLATCRSNLRQLGLATQSYLAAGGQFPGGDSTSPGLYLLLPYLERESLKNRLDGIVNPNSRSVATPLIPSYICPEDQPSRGYDVTSYAVNKGQVAAIGRYRGFVFDSVRPVDVSDGLSQTAFISEVVANDWRPGCILMEPDVPLERSRGELSLLCDQCAACGNAPDSIGGTSNSLLAAVSGYNHMLPPNSASCSFLPYPFAVNPPISRHVGGAIVLFADGSVRFVSNQIDRNVWWNMGTINSGDLVSGD